MIDAEKSDLYNVLAYVAFALPPLTHQQRADHAKPALAPYNPKLQSFLDFVLSKYVRDGIDELDAAKLPQRLDLKYRALAEAAADLGGVPTIRAAFINFQRHLYAP
jgi:type I restriction enzyme R subunit